MSSEFTDSVNEKLRQQFESLWIKGTPAALADYLPDKSDPNYVGTLEELVHIDLEFRWKRFGERGAADSAVPSCQDYLSQYPELSTGQRLFRLIQAEYELRHRYGDKPESGRFLQEIPQIRDLQFEVQSQLQEQLKSFDDETVELETGLQIGRYRLIAEHGRGGFGAVWRADDSKLGRRIALKRLAHQLSKNSESRRRFVSEARITARLEHPGIVPVYDISNIDEQHAYYTMKLVRGETMAQAIARVHRINVQRAEREHQVEYRKLLSGFIDVCNTIEYCHARGVIHRDLKPQNVVMGEFGETIVLDWGIASLVTTGDAPDEAAGDDERIDNEQFIDRQIVDDQILTAAESVKTLQGEIKGTPAYMPPEQARGALEQIDHRSDIYSLGAMLYQILTGQVPIQDTDIENVIRRVRRGDYARPREVDPAIPPAIEAVCLRAMHIKPESRYAHVANLRAEVERFMAGEPVDVYRESVHVRFGRWARKHRTVVAASILTILFAVVAGVAALIISEKNIQREMNRVAEKRTAAERAQATALAQLKNDQFQSAASFLEQASTLVTDEPALADLQLSITDQLARTQRIVDFYRLGQQAQEFTFFDQLSQSALYGQTALKRIGAIEHRDWWQHLPDQDLTPKQREQLRIEVYRQFGLLASMRFSQNAPQAFDFEWASDLLKKDREIAANADLRAAIFAAEQANAFRPSRLMEIIADFGKLVGGEQDSANFMISQPKNPTDAAMLGSILDTNAPTDAAGQMVLVPFLGMRDPRALAKSWLLEAVTQSPDWYWLSIFIGVNELKIGEIEQIEQSIRSFSHAVGVNPKGWVGYAYRATAYVAAANTTENRPRKRQYLRNATLDLQRARELNVDRSEYYLMNATLSVQMGGDSGNIVNDFMTALNMHPRFDHQSDSHFTEVSKRFFEAGITFADQLLRGNPQDQSALGLKSAMAHWSGDLELALGNADQLISLEPDHPLANAIMAMSRLQSDPNNQTEIKRLHKAVERAGIKNGQEFWYTRMDLANALRRIDSDERAAERYSEAYELANTDWQRAASLVGKVTSLAKTGDDAQTGQLLRQAMDLDINVDLDLLSNVARRTGSAPLVKIIEQHRDQQLPCIETVQPSKFICCPALVNGHFELGLATGWADESTAGDRVIWTTAGEGRSSAAIDDRGEQGKSLLIENSSAGGSDHVGFLQQLIPVTPGTDYRLEFSCRATDLSEGGVQFFVDSQMDEPIANCPEGDYTWRRVSTTFSSTDSLIELTIASKAPGTVRIDNITITSVSPAGE